nr:MAG TPA: hypothetical protein [Bacteriophage sp.]
MFTISSPLVVFEKSELSNNFGLLSNNNKLLSNNGGLSIPEYPNMSF